MYVAESSAINSRVCRVSDTAARNELMSAECRAPSVGHSSAHFNTLIDTLLLAEFISTLVEF